MSQETASGSLQRRIATVVSQQTISQLMNGETTPKSQQTGLAHNGNSHWKSNVFSRIRDTRTHVNIDDETSSFLMRGSLDQPAVLRAFQSGSTEQLSVKERAIYELLTKTDINLLKNVADANMAIYIMRKKVKNEMELAFMQRVLENLTVFKQNPELINNEIASSSLFKQLKHEFYPRRSVLFNFGDFGSKYYILLKGSAHCLIPHSPSQSEKSEEKSHEASQHQSSKQHNKNQASDDEHQSLKSSPREKSVEEHDQIAGKLVKAICQITAQKRTLNILESLGAEKSFVDSLKEEQSETDEEFLKRKFPHFKKVRLYTAGESFGEIALMTNKGRSATIVCEDDSHFLSLTKEGFDKIFGDYKRKIVDDQVNFLLNFWFFKSLPKYMLLQLMYNFKVETFTFRQSIFKETDPVKSIFLLKSGEIEISKKFVKGAIEKYQQSDDSEKEDETQKAVDQHNRNVNLLLGKEQQQQPHHIVYQKKKGHILSEEELRTTAATKKRVIVSKLGMNSYFGEHEIVNKLEKRETQAMCTSISCEVISIDKQKLRSLMSTNDFNILISSSKNKESIQTQRVRNSLLIRASTRSSSSNRRNSNKASSNNTNNNNNNNSQNNNNNNNNNMNNNQNTISQSTFFSNNSNNMNNQTSGNMINSSSNNSNISNTGDSTSPQLQTSNSQSNLMMESSQKRATPQSLFRGSSIALYQTVASSKTQLALPSESELISSPQMSSSKQFMYIENPLVFERPKSKHRTLQAKKNKVTKNSPPSSITCIPYSSNSREYKPFDANTPKGNNNFYQDEYCFPIGGGSLSNKSSPLIRMSLEFNSVSSPSASSKAIKDLTINPFKKSTSIITRSNTLTVSPQKRRQFFTSTHRKGQDSMESSESEQQSSQQEKQENHEQQQQQEENERKEQEQDQHEQQYLTSEDRSIHTTISTHRESKTTTAAPNTKLRLSIRNLIERIHSSNSLQSQKSTDSYGGDSSSNTQRMKSRDIVISQFGVSSNRPMTQQITTASQFISQPKTPARPVTPRAFPMNMYSHTILAKSKKQFLQEPTHSNSMNSISKKETSSDRVRLPFKSNNDKQKTLLSARGTATTASTSGIFSRAPGTPQSQNNPLNLSINRMNQSLSFFTNPVISESVVTGTIASPRVNPINNLKFKFSQSHTTLPQPSPRINSFFFPTRS